MSQLHLKIVTPEKLIFDEEVSQVNVPTDIGILGILPNHSALMAKLVPGELIIKKSLPAGRQGSKDESMAVGGGFLQVAENTLTVMTDLAAYAVDIDEKMVDEARKRAETALAEKLTAEEHAETLAILEKSLAQLHVKRRHRAR